MVYIWTLINRQYEANFYNICIGEMDVGMVNVGYWTRWRLHVVVCSALSSAGLRTVDAKTAFYGQTFTFYIIWHHHAGPVEGRGGGLWGWTCPCHNQIDRWCHWFVVVQTHRVRGAGCSCCHMQTGKPKPGNRHLSWVCLNFTPPGLLQWQSIVSMSSSY